MLLADRGRSEPERCTMTYKLRTSKLTTNGPTLRVDAQWRDGFHTSEHTIADRRSSNEAGQGVRRGMPRKLKGGAALDLNPTCQDQTYHGREGAGHRTDTRYNAGKAQMQHV